ncbi:hypothetical protein [Streptococcus henryi]|jgi:hypothetical protein|uniref:hypothetical protein n=1 Tax=Streptococcus henryi TaxID=439219 RepID=UPI0003700576|nr:hypothetical protein [Streptococcus henryi]
MLSDDLISRSIAIRKAYHDLEVKHHGKEWSIQEDLLALSNDIGNLNRLVMTKQGRYYDETPYTMEQKLAENIWWLLELSNRLEVDIQKEMTTFISQKEKSLGIQAKEDVE